MAIRALRSGPASNRAPPLPRALSTSASFSVAFGGASGCGCAGAVNRTVPIPACAAGTAGLTPVGAGTYAYDDASAVSKRTLFANAEVVGSNPGCRGGARADLDPGSKSPLARSYSEYAAANAAAAAAVAAGSSLALSRSAAFAFTASILFAVARASFRVS